MKQGISEISSFMTQDIAKTSKCRGTRPSSNIHLNYANHC